MASMQPPSGQQFFYDLFLQGRGGGMTSLPPGSATDPANLIAWCIAYSVVYWPVVTYLLYPGGIDLHM